MKLGVRGQFQAFKKSFLQNKIHSLYTIFFQLYLLTLLINY